MKITLVILSYLKWHYGKGIKSLFNIWKNFLTFVINFFSLKSLLRNMFDPWKRMTDPYPKGFSFKGYLFAFITNSITRAVGILMRFALLIVGLIATLLFILILPISLGLWLILPIIIVVLLLIGIYLILK